MHEIALVTCTADQPTGFALVEHFMQRQTLWGRREIQWLVADDGDAPANCTLGQTHLRRVREAGCSPAQSLCRNLKLALDAVDAPLIAIIEHDDFYREDHLANLENSARTGAWAFGERARWYYNVRHWCYRHVDDGAPALCQMGLRQCAVPTLRRVAEDLDQADWWGVDAHFWRRVPSWQMAESGAAIGIKGLPGRPGIGYGHRPAKDWPRDPVQEKLRSLVGDFYTDVYQEIMREN